jgi:hypothetical protein
LWHIGFCSPIGSIYRKTDRSKIPFTLCQCLQNHQPYNEAHCVTRLQARHALLAEKI